MTVIPSYLVIMVSEQKQTVYPSFQHKTDYPYATFDKMVCPSYT